MNDRLLESAKSGSRLGRRYSQQSEDKHPRPRSMTRSLASAKELGNSSPSPVKLEAVAASTVSVEPLVIPDESSQVVGSTEYAADVTKV